MFGEKYYTCVFGPKIAKVSILECVCVFGVMAVKRDTNSVHLDFCQISVSDV